MLTSAPLRHIATNEQDVYDKLFTHKSPKKSTRKEVAAQKTVWHLYQQIRGIKSSSARYSAMAGLLRVSAHCKIELGRNGSK